MNNLVSKKGKTNSNGLSMDPGILFVIKSVILVVAWRILYTKILMPIRVPDKILTSLIGKGTAFVINLVSNPKLPKAYAVDNLVSAESIIYRYKFSILRIGDSCNGLELMLIYIGLISLFPGKLLTKFYYIIIGTIVLIITNMIRCAGLEWVYEFHRPMFETTHHYLFTLVMYIIIFTGWVIYISKEKINE